MLAFLFEHNKAEDVWFLNYKYIISIKTIKKLNKCQSTTKTAHGETDLQEHVLVLQSNLSN